MMPTLRPGQTVIVMMSRSFRVGDIVVAFVNRKEVIKRITDMKNGTLYLEGDNKDHSTDSRNYGWVQDRHIIGKVIFPRLSKSK
jgi:phage repressor protein C with HTH and peptisase S24 domain